MQCAVVTIQDLSHILYDLQKHEFEVNYVLWQKKAFCTVMQYEHWLMFSYSKYTILPKVFVKLP